MALKLRWRRVLRNSAILVLVLVAGMAGFIQFQRHRLRARAERLLADVRELQSRKATWQDVEAFMARWKDWRFDEDLPCTPASCVVYIGTESAFDRRLSKFGEQHPSLNFLPLAYYLSQRGARAGARLGIRDGTITSSQFSLFLDVLSGPDPDWPGSYGLFGIAEQNARGFDPRYRITSGSSHPEYSVGKPGGCEGCMKLVSTYTPLVDRETLLKLTDFNFSCITRWSPCVTMSDILPSAWKIYEQESQGQEARLNSFEGCHIPIEALGREYKTAAIADVISRQAPTSTGSVSFTASIRVVRKLKGQMDWSINKSHGTTAFDRIEVIPAWNSVDLIPGKRYILLGSFTEEKPGNKVLALEECGVIPYNEQNLAAIQQGIDASSARDRRLRELGFIPEDESP